MPKKFWTKIKKKKKIVTENLKKKKIWKNILCFLTLTSVFPPLLRICLCYAFLLIFLCFFSLCFYSPFIFFINFSTYLSLSLVLVHSLESGKVVSQEPKWQDCKAKRVEVKKRLKKKKKTYNERLMGYNCKQDVWRWKKEWVKKIILIFVLVTYYNF